MPLEIEIKLRVAALDPIRETLYRLHAASRGTMLETNTFFDRPDQSLRQGDCGLRLRTETPFTADASPTAAASKATLTYKGPRQNTGLHPREEYNLAVTPPEHASAILLALGFVQTLSYEKRRETWRVDDCEVLLDELPALGTFLEIEGPSEAAVRTVQQKMDLASLPPVEPTYLHMIAEHIRIHHPNRPRVTFAAP